MWRKKLKLSAILSVLMAIIWLWQGYQGREVGGNGVVAIS